MTHCTYTSPVGDLQLRAQAGRLVSLCFAQQANAELEDPADLLKIRTPDNDAVLDAARRQLDRYFDGQLKQFDLPIAMQGTAFQLRVWSELRRIAFGQTISYRELAERVGKPRASRAVGSANAANPLAIIVPCHRVIASDGTLAGFAGGVCVKRSLLDHERLGSGQFALAFG